jgi:hypothetical protein
MTRFTAAAMLAAASLALAACGGATTQPAITASNSLAPTAPAVAPEASTPTPSPTPTPSILPITSDDLVDALPTNPMLTKVQGFTFKENKNWEGGDDEGPEWAADAPLTKEQKRQTQLGALRRVKPDKCEPRAAFSSYGWTAMWSTGDYFKAVAYTNKANSSRAWKDGSVFDWVTTVNVMPEGVPQMWVRNVAATADECKKFTTIASDGDLNKVNLSVDRAGVKREWIESGAAVLGRSAIGTEGGRAISLYLWEPIGIVLYESAISILSDDAKQWARASTLYNRLADTLAKAQGVERELVDLLGGTALIPNPAEYAPPASPSNSQA